MSSSSPSLPKGTITAATTFSLVSFLALLIGVPLLINDLNELENLMAHQKQIYMDMVRRKKGKKYFWNLFVFTVVLKII